MDPFATPAGPSRLFATMMFVASALAAAAILRFTWHRPLVAAAMLGALFAIFAARLFARWRIKRVLLSGDVVRVLARWSRSLERVPHPATMAPLMTATAFAAYGWVKPARAAMAAAERGPAWDAALEHRLFLDALLLTFEGDRDGAIEQATRLERMPAPEGPLAARVIALRRGVSALTRAFAHRQAAGDRELLAQAGESSALVHWAMRYAAAVIAIDENDGERAQSLLEGAPRWPEESAFRAFHDEITAHANS